MKDSNEVTSVCINPHIVGWYLVTELTQLKKLKHAEEMQMSQIDHPCHAKSIEEIYAFAIRKKNIEWPIKLKLQEYKKVFEADDLLTFEEMVDYFKEQLTALNAHEMIEQIVVDAAYAAHEQAEKKHLIDASKMGERLFRVVIKDSTAEEPRHVRDALIREEPVVSSSHSAVTPTPIVAAATFRPLPQQKATVDSALRVAAATFIPFSERSAVVHSIIVRPKVVRFALGQDVINVSEIKHAVDEPIENSRLYRFWMKPASNIRSTEEGCFQKGKSSPAPFTQSL